MKTPLLCFCALLLLLYGSCKLQVKKSIADTTPVEHERDPWPPEDSLDYVAIRDSNKLIHIKNQFYRDKKTGKLFDKMYAPKRADSLEAGVIYFFRVVPQDLDPLTFEVINDSWFARDKHFVYNYRPNDMGMLCIKIEQANVKRFKVLNNSGGVYGCDDKHFFEESDLIDHIDPENMRLGKDRDGLIKRVISGDYYYELGLLHKFPAKKRVR